MASQGDVWRSQMVSKGWHLYKEDEIFTPVMALLKY
jgi:hypothetical protein